MTKPRFQYTSLHQYLSEQRVLGGASGEIARAKKEYWKLYQKHYQKWYRKDRKPLSIIISRDHFADLEDQAESLGLSVKDVVELSIERYLTKQSRIKGIGQEVLWSLRRIHSEIVNHIRERIKKYDTSQGHLKALADRVSELENVIRAHFE